MNYMRVLVLLLIFAIGFSGYSAAVHAYDHKNCHLTAATPIADDAAPEDMIVSECSGHQVDSDLQIDVTSDQTTSKSKCMDCSHCCASHAVRPTDYEVVFELQSSVLTPLSADQGIGEVVCSPKRPPKFLV